METMKMNTNEKTMSIAIPPHGLIEHLRSMTDANDHSGARWTVANWIVQQLRAQGGTIADSDFRKAMSFYRVFESIATIHSELGHLPTEIYELRYRRTEEMLEFIGKANPEAADAIRKAL